MPGPPQGNDRGIASGLPDDQKLDAIHGLAATLLPLGTQLRRRQGPCDAAPANTNLQAELHFSALAAWDSPDNAAAPRPRPTVASCCCGSTAQVKHSDANMWEVPELCSISDSATAPCSTARVRVVGRSKLQHVVFERTGERDGTMSTAETGLARKGSVVFFDKGSLSEPGIHTSRL